MPRATQIVQTGFVKAVSLFFEYDTPKIVHIRSKKVGIINRIIQIVILAYIIGYAIIWEKGYQEVEMVVSGSTTKLKGTVYTNFSQLGNDSRNNRIWDVADYVLPPQENDAFFVMTNVVITPNQTQETCPEDYRMQEAICKNDDDCIAGQPIPNGNGVMNGSCVVSDRNSSIDVCAIYAWCPVEIDELPLGDDQALLAASEIFTVLIKNNVEFPKFGVKLRNILDSQNKTYLQNCRYDSDDPDDRLCPVFELGKIVSAAGENYSKLAVQGGIIDITINWDCNLDMSLDRCRPEYSFRRLDPEQAKIAQGWNFRYANYYDEKGVMKRDLFKAYGIRFLLKVTGQAGKFSMVPLLLSLGSGLGLLAVATVLCDIVVLYILKKGPYYQEKKYFYVTGDDAFQGLMDSDDDSDLLDPEANRQPGLLEDNQSTRSYNSMEDVDPQSSQSKTPEQRVKKRGSPPEGDAEQLVD